MIETEGLTKRFDGVTAVEALTLSVKEGEVFGFLGPNGAGKTTTMRMLTCLVSKTSGEARIDGYEVGSSDSSKIRKMVGVLPETVGLYEDLSAYKNLDFYGRLYECPEASRRANIENLLTKLGLWDRRNSPVGMFSKGMKQKVALARALLHDPKVVFLDEPTANLDPESSSVIRDLILEMKKEGRTVFINTHNLDEAQRVCDRVGIMKTKLLAIGTPETLRYSVRGRRTAFRLEELTEPLMSAVRAFGAGGLEVNGDELVIDVKDPDTDNPAIVEALVRAGGRVRFVCDRSPTLEDVYLGLVKGQA